MNYEYLEKFGFDYNKATQKIEDELKNFYTSDCDYTKQLFEKMLQLFKAPGYWGHLWFELMWISHYSFRMGGVPEDYSDILNFLDFMHALIYDTIDDGEIYILKTETYNRFHKSSKDNTWFPSEWSYGFRIYNRDPYNYETLGKHVLPEITRHDVFNQDNQFTKTEALKLSLTYVTFEQFIQIIDRMIDYATKKLKYEEEYIKNNNIDHQTFLHDMKHFCKFHDDYPDLGSDVTYDDVTYDDIFPKWKVCLYDKISYELIKQLTD